MQLKFPVMDKKPGLYYALTGDGLELPIIDVTNPAFEISLDDSRQETLIRQYIQEVRGPRRTPAFLRQLLFRFMRQRSVIMRGLMGASGTFMSGMNTYLMKLGPDNLQKPFFSDIDRRIAASPAGTCMRLRLQDVAQLLAEALIPLLRRGKRNPVFLFNIGGGSAMDSLNALIIIQKKQPDLLAKRQIHVYSLDQDSHGPNFGARALAALVAAGGPLDGYQVDFQHVIYDWSKPAELHSLTNSFQAEPGIVAVSSEGALFEYGSDEEIIDNLHTLNMITPPDSMVADR